ncbi:hypothetical protein DIPPA_29693 [Diplonema papillatum]|nr:hypothetical protein DIPPA_29693 [Diplonema papillatum]
MVARGTLLTLTGMAALLLCVPAQVSAAPAAGYDEFKALLKQSAQQAKHAGPARRSQLQAMMTSFATENKIDLKQMMTPEEYDWIFKEPGTYDESDESGSSGEEEEDEYDAYAAAEQHQRDMVIDSIRDVLQENKPSMLKKLPAMLKKYEGREQELLTELTKKYAK